MQQYLIQRLLLCVPTLLGVTLVVFTVVRLVPGDVVDLIVGDYGAASPEVKEAIRKEYSLGDIMRHVNHRFAGLAPYVCQQPLHIDWDGGDGPRGHGRGGAVDEEEHG